MPTNLNYISKVGGTTAGTGNLQFSSPRGLTTDGEFLWICDTGNDRIKKLRLEGLAFVAHYGEVDSSNLPIAGTGNDSFDAPIDIWYNDGHVFISDTGNNRIKIHRAYDFKFIKSFGDLSGPRGITGTKKYLWVADYGNSRIVKYDLIDLSVNEDRGSSGSGNQQLSQPNQIAYDKHEKVIYIADNGNNRLLKWDAHGLVYRDKVTIASLAGVAYKDHYLYVGALTAIKVHDSATLTQQATAGTSGTGNSNIASAGFVATHEDKIIFSDIDNHRIMVWYNYDARRALDSYDSPVIVGDFFINPNIPIGGMQEGESQTIGGSETSDSFRWIDEQPIDNSIAWVSE